MTVCNRVEGDFKTYKGYPSTCMFDTFIVTIPTLFLLCLFLLFFAIRSRRPGTVDRHNLVQMQNLDSNSSSKSFYGGDPGKYTNLGDERTSRNAGQSKIRWLFLALTSLGGVALFVVHVLQVSRLGLGQLGIGVLPIIFLSLLVFLLSLWFPLHGTNKISRKSRPHWLPWIITCLIFLIAMAVLEGVELYVLMRFETLLGEGKLGKTGSKHAYSVSARKIDLGVLTGLYALETIFYIALTVLDFKSI